MSKIFAIVIPIFSIIITTLFILFFNNSNKTISRKTSLILLGLGIFLLLGIYFFLINA